MRDMKFRFPAKAGTLDGVGNVAWAPACDGEQRGDKA